MLCGYVNSEASKERERERMKRKQAELLVTDAAFIGGKQKILSL